MKSKYLIISLFLFAILQTATSEECAKFDGEITDEKILLPTSAICSCYKPEDATPPVVAADDKTCNLNINLKAGIVQFSLADLCEKRKGCSIKSASISATEVSSILKPIDKPTDPLLSSTPKATESETVKPVDPAIVSATEVSSTLKPIDKPTDPLLSSTPKETESETVKPVDPAIVSATEVSSSLKPTDKPTDPLLSSTPKATESETVKPVDPAIISATEVSSTLKPIDKPTDPLLSSTPKATESETVKPVDPAIISATEVSSTLKPIDKPTDPLLSSTPKTTEGEPKDPVIGENGSSIASSTAPTSTITSSAESKDSSGITTTMSSLDKSSAGAHVNSEKSDSKFSGGVVFLLFLCGVVVGVLGFFMVIYIRKRYSGRSYETNDPPQEP